MTGYVHKLRRDFSRAASRYDQHATLQREIVRRLAAPLLGSLTSSHRLLDAGCGTGYFARHLQEQGLSPTILQLDAAEGMCRQALTTGHPCLAADMMQLPLADHCLDTVFSSLAMQWVERPAQVMSEYHRTLRPGGMLAIATLLPGTLDELRASFQAIGEQDRLQPFRSQAHWITAAHASGFSLLDERQENHSLIFPDGTSLLHHLKGLGATHKRNVRPLSPTRLRAMLEHYHTHHSAPQGGIQASFQVLLAWFRRA